jgi:hypothetical protein
MEAAASSHKKIASNIRELVVNPFGRWCEAHAARVQNSQDDLQSRIKIHDRQAEAVRKYRSQYYNKCRLVEDLEEEDKLAFQDPQSEAAQSPKSRVPTIQMTAPEDSDADPLDLGDETYQPEQVKKILTHMLNTLKLGEVKVPILGTYQNCSNGADITDYIQKHMAATSVSYAERIGQDIVDNGFLRLVGTVGNAFANSSRMNYQWKTKAFQLTGLPEKKQPLARSSTGASQLSNDSFTPDSPAGTVQEYLSGWNPLNNQYPNETPSERLRREARESDERYKASVKKLDSLQPGGGHDRPPQVHGALRARQTEGHQGRHSGLFWCCQQRHPQSAEYSRQDDAVSGDCSAVGRPPLHARELQDRAIRPSSHDV